MALKKPKKLKEVKENKPNFSGTILIGGFLIIVALFIPLNTFSPVLKAELNYQLKIEKPSYDLVDSQFSIVIPKISANSKVIKNVDPFDAKIYQKALTQGVAHAKNSSTPDQNGNVFIFAHSAGNWYQANQYNAVFYLINKLEKNDQIIIYYQDKPYNYFVSDKKFVNNSDVNYLKNNTDKNQLTLMTCWPPGTTLKRLIITAQKNVY